MHPLQHYACIHAWLGATVDPLQEGMQQWARHAHMCLFASGCWVGRGNGCVAFTVGGAPQLLQDAAAPKAKL